MNLPANSRNLRVSPAHRRPVYALHIPEFCAGRVEQVESVSIIQMKRRYVQTNSRQSPQGQKHCHLSRAERSPLGQSGGAVPVQVSAEGGTALPVEMDVEREEPVHWGTTKFPEAIDPSKECQLIFHDGK